MVYSQPSPEEEHGGVRILKGPPVPTVLPTKGVGVFLEDGSVRFYVLSRFNHSDTTVRTPVSFKSAVRLFWNVLRG